MNKNYVGTYTFGLGAIDLYWRHESGAQFWLCPVLDARENNAIRIEVGLDEPWPEVVSALCHEVMELAAVQHGARYFPEPSVTLDNGMYVFMFDHTKMSMLTAAVGIFLAAAWDDLLKTWEKKAKKG